MNAQQIAQVAQQAGFTGQGLINAVAVALAESGGNPTIPGDNGNSLGLWQIDRQFWPAYTPACLLDASCNARAAYAISNGGANWQPWSTWNNGAAQAHMAEAQQAVGQLGTRSSSVATAPTLPRWWPLAALAAGYVIWEVL